MDETLRVDRSANLVGDAPWFDKMTVHEKRPTVGILVEIAEVFFHCPKAVRRLHPWDAATWPKRSELPMLGQTLNDHVSPEQPVAEVDQALEASYTRTPY